MENHIPGRWAGRLASWRRHLSRRQVLGAGLAGGVLAGPHATTRAAARRSTASPRSMRLPARQDCSLGCETSICGQVPPECPIFPADNVWNAPVGTLPLDPNSDAYVANIGLDTGLHPDFGAMYEGEPIGIPFVRVPVDQPPVEVSFEIADESDPGPYPIPPDAPIEGGSCADGDRHVLVIEESTCTLYELFYAFPQAGGSWQAYSGARFDLTSNALRPATWTSADAAGLPILPGLVRFEEIESGVIPHALRFTAEQTREEFVWPATHQAGSTTDANVPPMGQRFRLKAGVEIADFSPTNQIILQALKTYGMFLADNGSSWFLTGAPDERWDNDDLHELQERITGADFEAVDSSSLIVDETSGQVA